MSHTATNSTTEDLERRLLDVQALIADVSEAADRLGDSDTSYDIGVELLDARRAVQAALNHLERATAPKIGPFFAPTVVRSPALDAIYAQIDECFA
jgi:hypothetical protein